MVNETYPHGFEFRDGQVHEDYTAHRMQEADRASANRHEHWNGGLGDVHALVVLLEELRRVGFWNVLEEAMEAGCSVEGPMRN